MGGGGKDFPAIGRGDLERGWWTFDDDPCQLAALQFLPNGKFRHQGDLSVRRQYSLLSLARSSLYYQPRGESAENLAFMEIIDLQFLETPWYGSRQMARHMQREGHRCGRHRVRRLMRLMRLVPIYQEPKTSKKHPEHRIYPYLLKGLSITRPNQVWCTDISYIPMRRGFLYLVAIMDWHSRKVLSWRLSNSMDAGFCVQALKEALARYGPPEIFNSDQGSQFTSTDFTDVRHDAKVKISMDGRGRWIDNRMIERFWRSLKYECVYLNAFETGSGPVRGSASGLPTTTKNARIHRMGC